MSKGIAMPDLLRRVRQAPDWIIPNFLKRQNVGFVIGPPKVGKSWLLLNLAWDLAQGIPVWSIERSRDGALFLPSRPMRVLYFAQEDTEDDIQDRITMMHDAGRESTSNILFVPKDLSLLIDTENGGENIKTIIADVAPIDLVIFDPLRRTLQGDENSSAVIASVFRKLEMLGSQFNCSFLFSHHTVKPSQAPGKNGRKTDLTDPFAGRGSGDIFGGGDAFVNVVAQGKHTEMAKTRPLKLYFSTKRAAPICPVNMRLSIPPGLVVFEGFTQGKPLAMAGCDN